MSLDLNCDWLKHWSINSPDKIALKDVVHHKAYSYRFFYQIVNRMAFALQEKGIGPGDRVAVIAHNRIETLFLFFALQRLTAILVPVNYRLSAPEADFVMTDCQAKWLYYDPDFSQLVQNLKVSVQASPFAELSPLIEESRNFFEQYPYQGEFSSPCMILYTSGTTGFPKGVVITSKILFWNSINTSMSLNLTCDDITINFSPFFHTGGWNVLLTPFIHRGATVLILPKFEGDKVLELCEQEKVTVFFGVPTTLSMMARSEKFWNTDLSSVRFAIVGGEPMALNMIQTWHKKGVFIRQGFGLTECGPNCFSLSEKDAESKIGSIGRPNFYVETRIIDDENNDVKKGEIGELLLRGPMCMTEYWQNPEATHQSFFEGWLRTGDLVKQDEENYFYVVGRKKEMYISGGENVYPAEIEKVISRHPEIAEVAVLGVNDPQWGEVGKAFVVTKKPSQVTSDDLMEFCLSHLARYKIPKKFEFLDELPKGDSGKILKKQLEQSL